MAEFYRSLDDANDYFDDQLFATDWTGATDANKLKALIQAVRTVDSLRFIGEKVTVYDALIADSRATNEVLEEADAAQAKKWPRDADNLPRDTPSTIQTIKTWATAPSAGTFTIQITLADGTTFTTAAIAFDATASAIESAIDAAATGVVTNWTNGDIAASGGPIEAADVVLTFSGDSVKEQSHNDRPVVTPDATFLLDGVLATPAATATITGECPDRIFWAQCEEAMTLISGRCPQQEWENSVQSSNAVSSSRSTSDRSNGAPIHTRHMFTSALAWKYVRKHIDYSENKTFSFHRTGNNPKINEDDRVRRLRIR